MEDRGEQFRPVRPSRSRNGGDPRDGQDRKVPDGHSRARHRGRDLGTERRPGGGWSTRWEGPWIGPWWGGETTAVNNLSIPTIFVGTNPFGLSCPSGPTDPSGDPSTGYPINTSNYYYVQGLNSWQAQCATASTGGTANVAWGDNLVGGSAALMVGHPIRVEVALSDPASTTMIGYTVQKLDPNALDRESAYGVLAAGTPGAFTVSSTATGPMGAGLWDAGAQWDIHLQNSTSTVFAGDATAEINATGRVVYGYNLRVQTAGTYVLEFTAPGLTLSSPNGGTVNGDTATINIVVTSGGGGGSGRGGGR